jgi:hypothetical protein
MFTWAGKPFTLDIAESDRVFDLKAALQSLTNVPPERQKILGLVKGKLPPDQERVCVYLCVFSLSGISTNDCSMILAQILNSWLERNSL